jgi:phage-related minor tail protein
MTQIEGISIAIDADTSAFRREMHDAEKIARGFGSTLTRAFEGAIVRGRDFGDVLRSLALRLSGMAINAALRPIEQGFAGLLQGLLGGHPGAKTGAPLGILPPGPPLGILPPGPPLGIQPFARGGVIATPSYFPLASSLGLAGERGAEAILPLARGADGRLGVRAGGEARPLAVTVNVSTPDAASFRRSEAYLSGVIARAVARGERNL